MDTYSTEDPLPILAEILNIPSWYTLADVRWYFANAVGAEWFVTFHYAYRPQQEGDVSESPDQDTSTRATAGSIGAAGEQGFIDAGGLIDLDAGSSIPSGEALGVTEGTPGVARGSLTADQHPGDCGVFGRESGEKVISKDCLETALDQDTSKAHPCTSSQRDDSRVPQEDLPATNNEKVEKETENDNEKTENDAENDNEIQENDPESSEEPPYPCVCVVQLVSTEALNEFSRDFNAQPWLDSESNPIDGWTCRIRRILIQETGDGDGPCSDEDVKISSSDLSRPPYIDELVTQNPYPRGNIATPEHVLMDFLSFGRIDPDTAEELGLLENEQDSELALTVAEIRGDVVHAVIKNIPHTFRSRDLRAYFEDFIDYGGFLMFHFNHRAMEPGDPQSPTMCVTKLTPKTLKILLEHYHEQFWIDAEGSQLASLCIINKPSEVELQSKKVQKELTSDLFPRGNVGTKHDLLMAFWQQGRISDPVAKRLGLLADEESDVEEDIKYEVMPDGSRRKVKRRKPGKGKKLKLQQADTSPAGPAKSTKSKFAAFEAHTSGFGRKLMEKLGWSEGSGLGRDQSGLCEPVAVQMDKVKSKSRSGVGAGKVKKVTRSGLPLPTGIHMVKE